MCLYPKLIKNKKYTKTKKNGGVIPAVSDRRVLAIPVSCGKCIECKKRKARDQQVRLLEDLRHKTYTVNNFGKVKTIQKETPRFVTLTFSTESLRALATDLHRFKGYDLDNEICKKAIRLFTERWRKDNKIALRHWLVTELGQLNNEHVHLHGILWTNKTTDYISKKWSYGHIFVGDYVNEKTVNYITKYISKMDKLHEHYQPKIFSSHGIGSGYLNRQDAKSCEYNGKETKEYYTTRTGYKIALPIYYRNKLYNDEQREKLWLHKLDKQERYILGKRIDISKNIGKYYNYLKLARQKNKRLGYGTPETDWDKKEYEMQRREMMLDKRINGDIFDLDSDGMEKE